MTRAVARYRIVADDSQSRTALQRVQRGFRDTARAAGPAIATLAGMATAGAALAAQSIKLQSELGKQARETGVSTEFLSEMRGTLNLIGGDYRSFSRAVGVLNRRYAELERGSTGATDAFDALGLSLADLQDLDVEDRIERVVGALARVEDQARRSAIAQQLFPDSFRTWLRLADAGVAALDDMREAQRRLGLSLTADQTAAAEAAEDAWERLSQTIAGVREQGAAAAAPVAEAAITAVTDALQQLLGRLPEERAGTVGARAARVFQDVAGSASGGAGIAGAGPLGFVLETLLRAQLEESRRQTAALAELSLSDQRMTGQFGSSFAE